MKKVEILSQSQKIATDWWSTGINNKGKIAGLQ